MRTPLLVPRPPRVPVARHQPDCVEHEHCGGRYRCVACGQWVGYCEGVSTDQNTCAQCWDLKGAPPKARYAYQEFERVVPRYMPRRARWGLALRAKYRTETR